MTKKEIILETVEYYKNNNRAVDDKSKTCYYVLPDNNRCAVGRCLNSKTIKKEKKKMTVGDIGFLIDIHHVDSLDELLKEKYKGHDEIFWNDLQDLHDSSFYWLKYKTKPGHKLTKVGTIRLKVLLSEYEH